MEDQGLSIIRSRQRFTTESAEAAEKNRKSSAFSDCCAVKSSYQRGERKDLVWETEAMPVSQQQATPDPPLGEARISRRKSYLGWWK